MKPDSCIASFPQLSERPGLTTLDLSWNVAENQALKSNSYNNPESMNPVAQPFRLENSHVISQGRRPSVTQCQALTMQTLD